MGQSHPFGSGRNKSPIIDTEEARADTFQLWPGIEEQLELSFSSIDINGDEELSYTTLEPVLRHHLMQAGLIEYVTRFSRPDGTLEVRQKNGSLRETSSEDYSLRVFNVKFI